MNDDDHPIFNAVAGFGIWYLLFKTAKGIGGEFASSVKAQMEKEKRYEERMARDPNLTMSAILAEEAHLEKVKVEQIAVGKRKMREKAKASGDDLAVAELKSAVFKDLAAKHPEQMHIFAKDPRFSPYLPKESIAGTDVPSS